jgi:NTP pyrophosphatase (non-canonical NTP hydrolase)
MTESPVPRDKRPAMRAPAAFPERLTLPALQDYVAGIVEERGFTQDVERVFVLWVEELGEMAEQLAGTADAAPAHPAALAAELADVTLYLADLANGLSVSLERALRDARPWPSPQRPGADTALLSEWQRTVSELPQDTAEGAVRGLMAAAGQVARVLRKGWSGRRDAEASLHLANALSHVLRLANRAGIDLTRAMADKEKENAGRTWTY